MKTTKIGVMMAAMALLTVGMGGAQAQGVRRAGARQARMAQTGLKGPMGSLLLQLNLTPAQKQQIAGIAQGEKAQLKSIQMNATLSAADKKTQEKATRKEGRAKILAVLTPAQKAQLKQLVAQRRQQKMQNSTGTPTGTAPTVGTPGTPAPPANSPKTGSAAPTTGTGTAAASSDEELGDLDDLV